MATIKGITLEIGGDTQPIQKAFADVNKKTKDLQSELKQVERLLKLDPGNTELLAQKQKLLADSVTNTKDKLERLKKAQADVNEQFRRGEISGEQYRAFQREIVKTEQSLESLKNKSKEFGSVFTQQMELAGSKMQEVGGKITDVGKNMSMKVTAPIVAAGGVAFKMAADLQDAMGATDQVFKGSAESVKSWADSLETYYGIAEGEALEYGNMMGSMLQNIGGLTEEEAANQAQTLIKLAGDLTAMYGGTTESAIQALTGALKGNNTMLDNYGMAVNDAMIKTKAFEMGIYSGKGEMDLATKQAATLALIMEQSGAAQGQAAREADGASGTMRAFATEMKNLSTDIGEVLLPIITPLLASLGDIVKGFSKLSPETKKTIVVIAGLAAAIGPVLIVMGSIISSVGVIMGAFGGLAAFLPSLGALFTALTGPIGIVIAIVAALAASVYLVIKNWDQIKEFFSGLWETVKNIFSSAWEAITNFLSGALQGIINLFMQYHPIGIIISQWDEIKAYLLGIASQAIEWGSNIVQGLVNGIRERIGAAVEAARELGSSVAEAVKNFFSIRSPSKVMEDFGRYIAEGLADGIGKGAAAVSEATSKMMSAVTGAVDKVISSIDLSVGIMEKKFKLIELTVGKSMNSLEKYGLKKSLLGEQISAIADQATVLEAAYAKIADVSGPESDEALKMYGRLLDAKIKYAEMQDELGKITQNESRMRKNMVLIESGAALASGAKAVGVVGGGPVSKEVSIEVNNYGTKGESAEGATTRELQKLQYLGVFG